jgi:hypothetical protein
MLNESKRVLAHQFIIKGRAVALRSIIEGRERIGALDLMRLIHSTNPTGRELDSDDSQHLYAVKSALQSALIITFPESLEIQVVKQDSMDTWQEDLVAIRHRLLHGDACHARVSKLSPEAATWVRTTIRDGVADSASHHSEPDPHPQHIPAQKKQAGLDFSRKQTAASVEEILAKAQSQVEEFDFEAASESFREAFLFSSKAPKPTKLYFEFLLDTLADANTIQEESPRLPSSTRREPAIQNLLICSLSLNEVTPQHPDFDLNPAAGERAGEAVLARVRVLIRRNQLLDASRHLDTFDWATRPDLRLEADREQSSLSRIAISKHSIEEEAISQLLESGNVSSAAKLAQAAIEKWPGLPMARKALLLNQLESQTRQNNEFRDAAGLARSEARFEDEVKILRNWLEASPENTEAKGAYSEAKMRLFSQKKSAHLKRIESLRIACTPNELALYWDNIPSELKLELVKASGWTALGYLNTWASAAGRKVPPERRAWFAMSLSLLDGGGESSPSCSSSILDSQLSDSDEELLSSVPRGREILSKRSRLMEAEAAKRAKAALESVVEWWDVGDERKLDEIAALLSTLDKKLLPEASLQGVSAMQEILKTALDGQSLFAASKQALEDESVTTALNLALRAKPCFVSHSTPVIHTKLIEIMDFIDELKSRIFTQSRFLETKDPMHLNQAACLVLPITTRESGNPLSPNGRFFLHAEACGLWIFLALIEVRSNIIFKLASFRSEFSMDYLNVAWGESEILLQSSFGSLSLEPDTLHVKRGYLTRECRQASRSETFEKVPDAEVAVVETYTLTEDYKRKTRVSYFDPTTGRLLRHSNDPFMTRLIKTPLGWRFQELYDKEIRVCSPGSESTQVFRAPNSRVEALFVLDAERVLLLLGPYLITKTVSQQTSDFALQIVSPTTRALSEPLILPGFGADVRYNWACDVHDGYVFLSQPLEPKPQLAVVRISENHALELISVQPFGECSIFARPLEVRGVAGLLVEKECLRAIAFDGGRVPECKAPHLAESFKKFEFFHYCADDRFLMSADESKLIEEKLMSFPIDEPCEWLADRLKHLFASQEVEESKKERMAVSLLMLVHKSRPDLIEENVTFALAARPDWVGLHFFALEWALFQENCDKAKEYLKALTKLVKPETPEAQSHSKLCAILSYLCESDLKQFTLTPLPPVNFNFDSGNWLELLQCTKLRSRDGIKSPSLAVRIWHRMALSDEAFAAGDFTTAFKHLDVADVWRASEMQSLTRLVRAANQLFMQKKLKDKEYLQFRARKAAAALHEAIEAKRTGFQFGHCEIPLAKRRKLSEDFMIQEASSILRWRFPT